MSIRQQDIELDRLLHEISRREASVLRLKGQYWTLYGKRYNSPVTRMKTIFAIQCINSKSFRWTARRGKNVVNHSYNKRRQLLTQLLAYLTSIKEGQFEIKGLSAEEQEFVHDTLT